MTNRKRFEKALCDSQKSEQMASESKREQLAVVSEQIVESEAEAAKLAEAAMSITGG